MRKYFDKWKVLVMLMAVVITAAIPGVVSHAKTISKKVTLDKQVASLGDEIYVSGSSVKINNKSITKYKKKIKSVKTGTDPSAFSYQNKAYFKSSNAYSQYSEYTNATSNGIKYVSYSYYTMRFLKTGTYTISYVQYEKESLGMDYYTGKYVNGQYVSYYKLVDNDGKQSSELYERKVTNSGETYYQGITSKAIYASSGYESGIVAASVKTGADKLQHVYCQPRNVIKTTYSRTYKVLKTSGVISSVTLGKKTLTNSNTNAAYSSSSSSKRSFLTGTSGKLTVKTASSNYSIMSIVVRTYDKNGKPVYKKVSNKKKITYGAYKSKDSYSGSAYSYTSSSLYKPTTIYVSYKNKFTGAFYKVNSISTDSSGNTVFSVTYRNEGETKNTTCTTSSVPSGCTSVYTFYKK